MDPETIAKVLAAWGHQDDWGVSAVYVKTAAWLLGRLAAGEDPDALVAEADSCESDSAEDDEE